MIVLTKNQKIAFGVAVAIIFVGGIIAGIVIYISKSKSKDPVKPVTTSFVATTKPPATTTSSVATTKPPNTMSFDSTTTSFAATTPPAITMSSDDTTSFGATTPPAITMSQDTTSFGATTSPAITMSQDDTSSGATTPTLGKKEVYYANKSSTYAFTTLAEAEKYATSLGGTIASFDQLVEAYRQGLNQCSFAWGVTDQIEGGAIYTVTTKQMNDDTCRFPEGGVTQFFPNHPEWTNHPRVTSGGVWVYGVKKPKAQSMDCANSNVPCVLPFSETKWSQYD